MFNELFPEGCLRHVANTPRFARTACRASHASGASGVAAAAAINCGGGAAAAAPAAAAIHDGGAGAAVHGGEAGGGGVGAALAAAMIVSKVYIPWIRELRVGHPLHDRGDVLFEIILVVQPKVALPVARHPLFPLLIEAIYVE